MKGRRREHRHDLGDHLVVRAESLWLVAAERVLDRVHQALIAVRAGTRWTTFSAREHLHQVVVRNQRPGHRHDIAQPVGERLLDDRRRLKSSCAQHRDAHGLLDAMRIRQVHPFDERFVAASFFPAALEDLPGRTEAEEQEIAERQQPARYQRVVGFLQFVNRQVAGRILGVGKIGA